MSCAELIVQKNREDSEGVMIENCEKKSQGIHTAAFLKEEKTRGLADDSDGYTDRLAGLRLQLSPTSVSTPPALVSPSPRLSAPLILSLGPKDASRVQDFLRRTFFKDEPLNQAVQLLGENGDERCVDLEEFCVSTLHEGMCFSAEMEGEMVGVLIGGLARREDDDEPDPSVECSHPKFSHILRFLHEQERAGSVFPSRPHLNECCDMKIIAVDSRHAGKGIATTLFQALLRAARARGLRVLKSLCTSHYSARILLKHGCHVALSTCYQEYRPQGHVVFPTRQPHTHCQLLVREL